MFQKIRKEKEKARSAGASSNKNSDLPPRKCFRCGSVDHLIANCPKPPKDGEKKNGKKVSFKDKEKGNSVKDNSDDDDDLKVYTSMARMSAQKCFRCGSDDHLIAKCPKPPKDGENKNGKKVSFKYKEKGNSVKDNSDDDDDLKVYRSMARMSNDDVSKNKDYGDSSQLTNWILDSGATCHMTPVH